MKKSAKEEKRRRQKKRKRKRRGGGLRWLARTRSTDYENRKCQDENVFKNIKAREKKNGREKE